MLIAAVLWTAGGCSKPLRPAPETYPVTGAVVVTRSRLPVDGMIEFKPVRSDSEFIAKGMIDSSGKFKLKIPFVDRSLQGAIEGPHTVRVLLPLFGEGWSGGEVPVEGTFTVQASENHFTIKLP